MVNIQDKDKKIPNAPNQNYYEFGLKGENDGVFLVKNRRKGLGTDAGSTKQDFMETYKRMIEKDEPIHLGDKKIKMGKEEERPKPKKEEKSKVKIEPVIKETMSDLQDKVEVKDVLDKIVDKIEEKKELPKTIRIKKSKSKKSDESEKIVQELFDEILKDVDEMQKKQEEKEAKRKSKKETKEMQTQTDSPKKSKEIQTQTEKETKDLEIQISPYDIDKEDRKQKKIIEKERKEIINR